MRALGVDYRAGISDGQAAIPDRLRLPADVELAEARTSTESRGARLLGRYHSGFGSSLNTSCSAKPQRVRIILKYSLSKSMLMCVASLNSSRRTMARSKGGPTGEIRADGRVHGYERALGRLREAARARDHAVDDGFAVLRLADLKVGRVARGLDEVAGGIDVEQPRLLAAGSGRPG